MSSELTTLLECPVSQRHEHLTILVRTQLARLLRFDSIDRVSGRRKFMELGLDSLMALELRNRLTRALGLSAPLSATLMFDHPNAEALAGYLLRDVLGLAEIEEKADPEIIEAGSRSRELEQLEEEEVEALLLKKLDSL